MEIERKFLLDAMPSTTRGPRKIRQGYLAVDGDVEVRIRDDAGNHELTVKGGAGRARTEVTVPLDAAQFEELWPATDGRRITKWRSLADLVDGLVAEVDEYDGELTGLVTAEVEFPDAATADVFTPPEWLGHEVTGDKRYANQALATSGRPPA